MNAYSTALAETIGGASGFPGAVLQESAQAVTTAGMPQFAQCFGLDLADALARDREVLAYFFERVLAAVFQAKPHFDDFFFARREGLEYLCGLLAQVQIDYRFRWRDTGPVDDEVAQMRLVFFSDGCLE